VQRISVVGISGAGKSTLADRLADRLDIPHIEIDGLFHLPGWAPRPVEDLQRIVAERLTAPGWVCDGNYKSVQGLIWGSADTVVWLDPPRRTVMRQVIVRTLRRIITRQELWNGNRETFRNAFFDRQSIILWAWTQHAKVRARYTAAMGDPQWTKLDFIRLASRAEVERFLAGIR
jgi:adenylate kinase family enzyme